MATDIMINAHMGRDLYDLKNWQLWFAFGARVGPLAIVEHISFHLVNHILKSIPQKTVLHCRGSTNHQG